MRSAEGTLSAQDAFSPSLVQQHALGSRLALVDGRVYRYAQAGAADLVAGNLLQAAAPITTHLALTSAAAAIGATSTVVTPGATAGAANLYSEGYLGVSDGPGVGLVYRIAGHAAITASVAFTLNLDEPVAVAFTTATRYGLIPNLYKNVIQSPVTAKTGAFVGVAPCVFTAAYYGWIQTWGVVSLLINGTLAATASVQGGVTTAGSVDVWSTLATSGLVGEMMQAGVSTKNNFVYLKIAP